jgi:hypothetical protein
MTDDDEILAREMAKIGILGGPLGPLGSYLAAKVIGNDTFDFTFDLQAPPRDVLTTAYVILQQVGRIRNEVLKPEDPPTIVGIVGSGILNLNPALVKIVVVPSVHKATSVYIRGTAKEGLIKQHAGREAAKRIGDLLIQAFSH